MKLGDRLIGVLAIAGGIAVIMGTLDFRAVPGQQFGSAFFPRIVGGIIVLTGIAQILLAKPGRLIQIPENLDIMDALRKAAVIASVAFWLLTVNHFGFLLSTSVVVGVLSIVMGARVIASVLVAVGSTFVLYLVFSIALRVPLPRGPIEALIS